MPNQGANLFLLSQSLGCLTVRAVNQGFYPTRNSNMLTCIFFLNWDKKSKYQKIFTEKIFTTSLDSEISKCWLLHFQSQWTVVTFLHQNVPFTVRSTLNCISLSCCIGSWEMYFRCLMLLFSLRPGFQAKLHLPWFTVATGVPWCTKAAQPEGRPWCIMG